MALEFPLATEQLADLLPIETAIWMPMWQQEQSGVGNGEVLTADLGPRLWEADVGLKPVNNLSVRALKSRIEALDGSAQRFYLYDPLNCYPTHDPGGVLLGASAVTILAIGDDSKSLSLQGLPVGYVLAGDLLAIDYGDPSRRALLRMVGGGTAGGDGKLALTEVRPHLRPGIVPGLPVTLVKPAAKVTIVAGSLAYERASVTTTRIRFRVRQTLAAG